MCLVSFDSHVIKLHFKVDISLLNIMEISGLFKLHGDKLPRNIRVGRKQS
jgi:hypothetical protein